MNYVMSSNSIDTVQNVILAVLAYALKDLPLFGAVALLAIAQYKKIKDTWNMAQNTNRIVRTEVQPKLQEVHDVITGNDNAVTELLRAIEENTRSGKIGNATPVNVPPSGEK